MKTSNLSRGALSICIAAIFLPGCGGSQAPIGAPGAVSQSRSLTHDLGPSSVRPSKSSCPTAACIYVVNDEGGDRRITVYPTNANGNVRPYRDIAGSKTGLLDPNGVAVDSQGEIYASGRDRLLVYSASANGNVKPLRTIAGRATHLDSFNSAVLALDSNSDAYVADDHPKCGRSRYSLCREGYVTVYAAGAHGNVAPIRIIRGKRTRIWRTQSISVDSAGYAYVATYPVCNPSKCRGETAVLVYAPGANGDVAPAWSISGSRTGLMTPEGTAVDDAGNVYVADLTGSVLVYAAGQHGNVAPIQAISGQNTGLIETTSVAVDAARNIYVTNAPSGTVYHPSVTVYAAGATGDVAPIQIIKGSKTLLYMPWGIAIH